MKRLFTILLLLICTQYTSLQAQQAAKPIIRNLVFEGAGIRGIAYAGVLEEMKKQGMLDSLERVGGTSAGAIVATVLALGYSTEGIRDIIYHTEFNKFNDGRMIFLGGFNRLTKRYGWYRGEAFASWMGELIKKRTGNADITFKQWHDKGGIDLYLTGTSLNRQQAIIFSHETYPDMRIRDAVRISMSVPLYYAAVFIDKYGQVINEPKQGDSVDIMVDGGILANFPIHIFDEVKYVSDTSNSKRIAGRSINLETVGVRIDSDEQMAYDTANKGLIQFDINGFTDYMTAFYNLTLENLNRHSLVQEDWQRTISISSKTIGPKVRHLSDEEKNMLIESGHHGVKLFFEKKP